MDIEAHRDLKLLEEVALNSRITQRSLATKLGIALGLTNIYLRRLVRKGYIKCVNVQSNRISYLITPRGIAEKARLTYEFMDYSLHLYREVRQHLRAVLQECAAADRRVAIYGRGEAAELAYLSLKECGLEPVAIFDGEGGRAPFLAPKERGPGAGRDLRRGGGPPFSRHSGPADRRTRRGDVRSADHCHPRPLRRAAGGARARRGAARQTVSAAPRPAAA